MNDQEAITLLQQGDLRGLASLVRRHQTQAIRVAYAIVRERTLAEDVAQGAFVHLPQSIRQFDVRRPFTPWFMRVVAHDAIRALRRDARIIPLDEVRPGSGWLDPLADSSSLPEELTASLETREQLWALLGRLSPEQRAVMVLRYYSDLSGEEIAEELRIPAGTVRWRIHAALRQLRRWLLSAESVEGHHPQKQEIL